MITVILVVLSLVIVFFILTIGDGKYFSKKFMYYVYNILGPKIFSSRSEKDKWVSIYKKLEIASTSRIIDVGTAIGDLPLSLASISSHTGKIVGVDWSTNMIEYAKLVANRDGLSHKVEFKQVDIRDGLPYENNSFDVLFCIGLLEGYHNHQELINELARVVTQNGMIIIGLYKSGVRISKDRYSEQLKNFGFSNFEVIDFRRSHDLLVTRH